MTDGQLQDLIRSVDFLPRGARGSVAARRRTDQLAAILAAILERGGIFQWNGIAYHEKPKGELHRSLVWRGPGSRRPEG